MDHTVLWSALALGGLGCFLGVVLAVFSRIFAVKTDPRIDMVEKVLPGINCGVCGFAGCHAMAEALVERRVAPKKCAPGGKRVVERVARVLGVEEEGDEPMVAVVRCQGGYGTVRERADYRGVEECVAAALCVGGAKACVYGCLGFGTCVASCPFGAIRMTGEGLPRIVEEKCTGCGKCVASCPRNLIELVPRSQLVYVACSSREKGKPVRDACARGCIACGMCAREKITPSGSVVMRDNLPVVSPAWTDYRDAVERCPMKCFVVRQEEGITGDTSDHGADN